MRTSAASVEQTRFAQDALERPKPTIRVGLNGEPMLELIPSKPCERVSPGDRGHRPQ